MAKAGTVGLSNVMYSVITYGTDGTATYGTPKKLAPAIDAKIAQATDAQVQYADDAAVDIMTADGEITVDFTGTDLTTDVLKDILGKQTDTNGVMLSSAHDLPPYVALMFKSRKGNGKYRYVCLYKGKFTQPDENYATKQGKADVQNAAITGTFVARDDDDFMKARVDEDDTVVIPSVLDAWFTKPYEPVLAP
jgi:phi13 family phage major tail protein